MTAACRGQAGTPEHLLPLYAFMHWAQVVQKASLLSVLAGGLAARQCNGFPRSLRAWGADELAAASGLYLSNQQVVCYHANKNAQPGPVVVQKCFKANQCFTAAGDIKLPQIAEQRTGQPQLESNAQLKVIAGQPETKQGRKRSEERRVGKEWRDRWWRCH